MKNQIKYTVYLSIVTYLFLLNCSETNAQANEPIRLRHADSLVGSRFSPSGHVRKYGGNVQFSQ